MHDARTIVVNHDEKLMTMSSVFLAMIAVMVMARVMTMNFGDALHGGGLALHMVCFNDLKFHSIRAEWCRIYVLPHDGNRGSGSCIFAVCGLRERRNA